MQPLFFVTYLIPSVLQLLLQCKTTSTFYSKSHIYFLNNFEPLSLGQR